MIVKVAPNRRDGKSSFEKLGDYITEGIEQSGDRADRTSWDDLTQYITKQTVLDALGDDVEKTIGVEVGNVHSLEHAPKLMRSTAERCPRATNPVLHYILSWPEGERPEPRDIFAAARHTLAALGLQEHQYIVAIHDNTENRHAHIEVNRVHPITFRAARLEWMFKTLHKAAREAEIEHGWSHDNGLYEVVEVDGRKVVVEAAEAERIRASFGANRTEAWSGEASLETWCRGEPAAALKAVLADPLATSWQHVHAALARFGLELRDAGGGGMRVHDVAGQAGQAEAGQAAVVSASKAFRFLKRADAEARFGRFEPAAPDRFPSEPVKSYKRDPHKRLERRLERKAMRDELHARFQAEQREARSERVVALNALKQEFRGDDRRRLDAQRRLYQLARAAIRADLTMSRGQKQQAYMLAKLSFAQQRDQLRTQLQEERAERRALVPSFPTWREWVEQHAQAGDDAAISALRGMVYQEKRDAKKGDEAEVAEESVGTITAAPPRDTDPYVRALRSLSWQVSSHGAVTYRLTSGAVAFVDAGAKLRFGGAVVSDDALRVALRYAADKWQSDLQLNGGDRVFRERVARLATEMRIDLKNADLRSLQLQLRQAASPLPYAHPIPATQQAALLGRKLNSLFNFRKENSHGNVRDARDRFNRAFVKPGAGGRPDAYSDRPGTPAQTINGLRSLSGIPVVRVGEPTEVLLPGHARGDVEHERTERPGALRRPGHGVGARVELGFAPPEGTYHGRIVSLAADHLVQQTDRGLVRHPTVGLPKWVRPNLEVAISYERDGRLTVQRAPRGRGR